MIVSSAILDDGIYPGAFPIPDLVEEICFGSEDSEKRNKISHGTICAAILHQLAPDMVLHSVKVLDRAGKGSLDELKAGLNWCLENEIKLVHLSLGTELYHDFLGLDSLLQKLITNGTILVSAFSNRNIPSYPAFFPGVFGVRQADERIGGAAFALCENSWLRATNAWIAMSWPESPCLDGSLFRVPASNSFAAPILTAQIYGILSQRPGCTIAELQSILTTKAGIVSPGKHGFNSFVWAKRFNNTIPVVLVQEGCVSIALDVASLLKKDGYTVEVFGQDGSIPLSLYMDKGTITNELVNGLVQVYNPDILLITLDNENIAANVGDAWIKEDIFTAGGFHKKFDSAKDLEKCLIEAFTNMDG